MDEANEAYTESVKGWLRIQENSKKRNEREIELTKKQMILDDEVTRLAIVDFNVWAKENGVEGIKVIGIDLANGNDCTEYSKVKREEMY